MNPDKGQLTPDQILDLRHMFNQLAALALNGHMKPSTVLHENGCLRWKSQINGVPKLQGVFRLRDQEGFPLDMSFEIARDRGWDIDWVEALADAARQCIFKFEALLEEIRMLEPEKVDIVQQIFAAGLMASEGETFCEKAQALYQRMHTDPAT